MTTITGLFKDKAGAEQAFQSVIDLGYTKDDINVAMSDEVRRRYFPDNTLTTAHPGTELEEKAASGSDNSPSDKLGGPAGGTMGTLMPVVTAVGVALIPGFGIVAGPVAIALTAAAATGIAVGLVAALKKWDIPESRVQQYEAAIRAGGILLGVKAHSDSDALQIQRRWRQGGGEYVQS